MATYFPGRKIKWILDNVEGVREAAERGAALFGNMDPSVIWWLTGGPEGRAHVTDLTNASRRMLFNLETLFEATSFARRWRPLPTRPVRCWMP